ncbi:hypothetical protein [Acutalibacter sp. JLR.KK004]
MNDAQFLNLICQIQPTMYKDIGLAVGFGNIYKALSPYGEDQDSIKWRVEQLERQQKLEVFRLDSVISAVRVLP